MSASTPLFEATIEPDEDFPSGNIGSSGRARAEPVVLTPVPAKANNTSRNAMQGGGGDAEMGIVSCLLDADFANLDLRS
jgi:hypothetical protein